MLERLKERLLVDGPPWQITGFGEDALAGHIENGE